MLSFQTIIPGIVYCHEKCSEQSRTVIKTQNPHKTLEDHLVDFGDFEFWRQKVRKF